MKRVRGKQAARVGFGGPTNKEGFFVALAKPPVKEIGASSVPQDLAPLGGASHSP